MHLHSTFGQGSFCLNNYISTAVEDQPYLGSLGLINNDLRRICSVGSQIQFGLDKTQWNNISRWQDSLEGKDYTLDKWGEGLLTDIFARYIY